MSAILVPVDGSPCASRAVDHAVSLARRCGAELHLLNVQPEPDPYGMVGAYLSARKQRAFASERGRELLDAAASQARRAKVPFQTHLSQGEPAAMIARAARRMKCESIVMGTRGHGAIGNLLLGSVATKVVHLAKAPVTLVK